MRWLTRLFRKRKQEAQLDAELRFHLDQRTADLIATGVEPAEARRRARIEFGGVEAAKEECREARPTYSLESLFQDIRYGARMLRKSRGFTIVAVITLALGIGANTAIFSLVEAVLLRPLPYPHASQLVTLWGHSDVFDFPYLGVSLPDLADVRNESRSLGHLAVWNSMNVNLTGHGTPQQLSALQVSGGFFQVFGVAPLLGRTFVSTDARPGHADKVVLSEAFWRKHLGANPHAVGRSILLNGSGYTIVGVMPRQFDFPTGIDLWMPFVPTPAEAAARGRHGYPVVGRLAHGSTIPQAQAELNTIAARLARSFPKTDKGWGFRVQSMKSYYINDTRTTLLVLFGAVGLVLLIACANVGNLYLARAWSRTQELAIRAALGASRGRLIRQLLVEGLLLAMAGGAAGLLLAEWAMEGLRSLIQLQTPRLQNLRIDGHVLWFTLGASLAAGIVFGLVPAFLVSRDHLASAMREAGSGREVSSSSPRQSRLRQLLVVGEVALALVLVVAAGLMLRSFAGLSAASIGFRSDRVLTMELDFPSYRFKTPEQCVAYSDQILEKVRRAPGVEEASGSVSVPLGGFRSEAQLLLPGHPTNPDAKGLMAGWNRVTPGYFHTLGIPILAGRSFNENDRTGSEPVAIVNRAFARRYFGSKSPIGQQISLHDDKQHHHIWSEIVGEVGNVRNVTPSQKPAPAVYEPYVQNETDRGTTRRMTLLVRTKTEPMALAQTIKDRIWSVDQDQPITKLRTMTELVSTSYAEPRSQSLLLSLFGALGLVLALVGIYGVISYSVGRRTREIGIRIALGAQTGDVLRLVVTQGTKLVLAGVVIGLAASFAATRLMHGLLYGVTPTDPVTFAGVSILLVLAGLAACYIPARRATRVDPVVALRQE